MLTLKRLQINKFRCIKNGDYSFQNGVNIIFGPNGCGKTSIIESIYVTMMTKSFRTNRDVEYISENDNYTNIKALFELDDQSKEINYSFFDKKKIIMLNGKEFNRIRDYIGLFKLVCFEPNEVFVLKNDSFYRRKLLDVYISQIDSKYLNSLMNYNKVIEEKNALLKGFKKNKDSLFILKAYNNLLINDILYIHNKRKKFIKDLFIYVNKYAKLFNNINYELNFEYKFNYDVDNLLITFDNYVDKEIEHGASIIGVHRDDLSIEMNYKNFAKYCSIGQQNTIVICLKLGIVDYLKEKFENVILILDDVFAELDLESQNKLLSIIPKDVQTIITTSVLDGIDKELIKKCNIIRM